VKRALLILVVVIVVVTGLPLVMGMGHMGLCHDCGPAVLMSGADCLPAVLLGSVTLALLVLAASRLRSASDRLPAWLFASLLDRPPQLV